MSFNGMAITAMSGLGVRALNCRTHLGIINEGNRQFLGILDHMIVGHDQKLLIVLAHNNTGTAARNLYGLTRSEPGLLLHNHRCC